jgi:hypothetical protein
MPLTAGDARDTDCEVEDVWPAVEHDAGTVDRPTRKQMACCLNILR